MDTIAKVDPAVHDETASSNALPRPLLPKSYYELMEQVPPEVEGMMRVSAMAERLQRVPMIDRKEVRDWFKKLAEKMIELKASDLDFGGPACKGLAWYRVDGFKEPHKSMGEFTHEETDLILLSLLSSYQIQHLLKEQAIDFGYSLDIEGADSSRRYRTTIYFDNMWLGLSMRMLAWKPRSMQSLGFHRIIERGLLFRHVRDGLTLVTGVTGSGKSTTLDAIVDANNRDIKAHILIVAQPLEYIHTSNKCIIRHREVGVDVPSFVHGLVQGLRQDPDIIVIGEMRNAETMEAALETSDTGHKVFSTLHTGSAVESVERIIAEYPPDEQSRVRHRLGDVLSCIISQKLLPGITGGRILAKEVLWVTPSVRAAIKNGNTGEIYQMIWEGRDHGMITLEQDLNRLLRIGDIDVDTALSYANNKRRLLQIIR